MTRKFEDLVLNWARIHSSRPGLAVFSGGIERAGNHLHLTVLEAFGKRASVAYVQILGSCIDWLLSGCRCTVSVSWHDSFVCAPPYVHFEHPLSPVLLLLYWTGDF